MNPKFRKGEWCFCEFTLQMVKETKTHYIVSTTDGTSEMWSSDLSDRCFPLTLDVKRISDFVAYYSNEFHKVKVNINHPDIHRYLVDKWTKMCESLFQEIPISNEKLKLMMDEVADFYNKFMRSLNGMTKESIDGVNIFR